MAITTRPITEDESLEFLTRLVFGFGEDLTNPKKEQKHFRAQMPLDRTVAAFDGDTIVGTLGGYPLELTVPGGASVPMAGTTMVTVQNTHRRQGVLRSMMSDHLDDTAARGEPLAGLWASEAPIYGRFGFGHATSRDVIEAKNNGLALEPATAGDVRNIEPDQVTKLLPAVYDEVRAATPGMLSRTTGWWEHDILYDPDRRRRGKSKLRFVVYESDDGIEGFAIYRQKLRWSDLVAEGEVMVEEIVTATDRAHTALWHYLGNVDLFPKVEYWNLPTDDPLWWKLRDHRLVDRRRSDALYVRIIDVPAALEARAYETDGRVTIGIDDPFRPGTSGVYELAAAEGSGKCVAVDNEAEVTLGIDWLGALYLGGSNALSMAAAGMIGGTPDAIETLHRLFRTDSEPWCDAIF